MLKKIGLQLQLFMIDQKFNIVSLIIALILNSVFSIDVTVTHNVFLAFIISYVIRLFLIGWLFLIAKMYITPIIIKK